MIFSKHIKKIKVWFLEQNKTVKSLKRRIVKKRLKPIEKTILKAWLDHNKEFNFGYTVLFDFSFFEIALMERHLDLPIVDSYWYDLNQRTSRDIIAYFEADMMSFFERFEVAFLERHGLSGWVSIDHYCAEWLMIKSQENEEFLWQ